jgi:hypothetical protein
MIALGRWILRAAGGDRLVPMSRVQLCRQISWGTDSLIPRKLRKGSGKDLKNPFLAQKLSEVELGIWSMSAEALNFLEAEFHRHRPACILEFGSGVSTACVARFMQELQTPAARVCVYSFEQDPRCIEDTTRLLEITGTTQFVRLIHAPLTRQVIEQTKTICYAVPECSLLDEIRSAQPDFILIDGPAAEVGARFGTLPMARSVSKNGARFYLDDALRDSELETAQRWTHLGYVDVEGILPTEKGLLLGFIHQNGSV